MVCQTNVYPSSRPRASQIFHYLRKYQLPFSKQKSARRRKRFIRNALVLQAVSYTVGNLMLRSPFIDPRRDPQQPTGLPLERARYDNNRCSGYSTPIAIKPLQFLRSCVLSLGTK